MRDFTHDHSVLALNTATLGHNLDGMGVGWSTDQVIDACAARGLAGIVFWRREIGKRAQQIGEQVRSAGLQVTGLCRTPFLVGPLAPATHQAIMDDFRASIDMAAALGTEVLTIVTGGIESGTRGPLQSQQIVADRVAELAGYAATCNVKLALEPLHPMYGGNRTCIMTVRDALHVCNLVDAANVGVAVDVYHVWWDTNLAESCLQAGDRIFGYHVNDWLADTSDMLLDRGMMGDGVADLKSIRRAVEAAGYQGPCEVEIFSAGNWWQRDPNKVLDTMVERFRSCC